MRMQPRAKSKIPTTRELMRVRRGLPTRHLHESWLDDLYWEVELEQ